MSYELSKIKEGDLLPSLSKKITQQHINEYGYLMESGKKTLLIHYDKKVAQKYGFKDTVAHGTIGLGLVSEVMTRFLGRRWVEGGKISVKFIRPVFRNETITAKGTVSRLERDGEIIRIWADIWCENEHGEKVTVGSASGIIERDLENTSS